MEMIVLGGPTRGCVLTDDESRVARGGREGFIDSFEAALNQHGAFDKLSTKLAHMLVISRDSARPRGHHVI